MPEACTDTLSTNWGPSLCIVRESLCFVLLNLFWCSNVVHGCSPCVLLEMRIHQTAWLEFVSQASSMPSSDTEYRWGSKCLLSWAIKSCGNLRTATQPSETEVRIGSQSLWDPGVCPSLLGGACSTTQRPQIQLTGTARQKWIVVRRPQVLVVLNSRLTSAFSTGRSQPVCPISHS